MKSSDTLFEDLRRMAYGFIDQTFTDEMYQRIRLEVNGIINAAFDEGQSAMAPWVCSNANTSFCRQCEDEKALEDYDYEVCRKCSLEGGFSI